MGPNRPYADDWRDCGRGLQYSPTLDRWFKDGIVYDRRSAEHNGLIGPGRDLLDILEDTETIPRNK